NLDEEQDSIPLYEEQEINEELIITKVPNEAEIEVIHEDIDDNSEENTEELILIKYIETEDETTNEYEGYVNADYIFTYDELNELLESTDTTDDVDKAEEEPTSETDD